MMYTAPEIFVILSSCEDALLVGSIELIGGEDLDLTEPI